MKASSQLGTSHHPRALSSASAVQRRIDRSSASIRNVFAMAPASRGAHALISARTAACCAKRFVWKLVSMACSWSYCSLMRIAGPNMAVASRRGSVIVDSASARRSARPWSSSARKVFVTSYAERVRVASPKTRSASRLSGLSMRVVDDNSSSWRAKPLIARCVSSILAMALAVLSEAFVIPTERTSRCPPRLCPRHRRTRSAPTGRCS